MLDRIMGVIRGRPKKVPYKTRYRSAATGKFTSKVVADLAPDTHVREKGYDPRPHNWRNGGSR